MRNRQKFLNGLKILGETSEKKVLRFSRRLKMIDDIKFIELNTSLIAHKQINT